MDREVAETLAYFRQNISELKKLGKEWGLSDTEIEECVQKAMNADVKHLLGAKGEMSSSTSLKFAARKTWPKLRCLLMFGAVILVLCCAGALAAQSPAVMHRIEQIFHPAIIYPVLRAVRLLTVPLHAYPFAYDMYTAECLVNNPFFTDGNIGPDGCDICEHFDEAAQFTSESLEQAGPPPAAAFSEPLLFKGRGAIVDIKKMQEVLRPLPLAWKQLPGIKSNLEWLSQLRDLMEPGIEERLMNHPHFYFHWISKMTAHSQLIRKLFPRPDILGDREVSLSKDIYIEGPASPSNKLRPSPMSSFSWYIQGWGTRKLVLTPASECSDTCKPITVIMQAGDLLTYDCLLYSAETFPAGEDISVALLSFFVN